MTGSSRRLADRERTALADLLAELGPDAPTCCAGWDTGHLAAHVVVRDSRPDALLGYGVEVLPVGALLARWSHTVEDRVRASTPYAELVERVRSGPPRWMPFAWPVLGPLANTTEFVIHHEDVRRAQPGWTPRPLPRADQDQLWRTVAMSGRLAARSHREGLLVRRSATGEEKRFGRGSSPTTVSGEPLELLLWTTGRRDVARVDVTEPSPRS